jgi:hypothetical protein
MGEALVAFVERARREEPPLPGQRTTGVFGFPIDPNTTDL